MNIVFRGIDVSKYQGNINFNELDVDFMLIRAGLGNNISQIDSKFYQNVDQGLQKKIHIGAYWFSYATDTADAIKEADVFNKILLKYKGKIDFPTAFDWEYDSEKYFKKVKGRNPTNDEINLIADAFLSKMRSYGWFVNIYTNCDFIRSGRFSQALIKKYDVWLADYTGGPDFNCQIQQTGSTGKVNGISGNVDIDVCFKDYSTIIKAGGYNGYTKPITTIKSDTTGTYNILQNGQYIFKTTSSIQPIIKTGTPNVINITHMYRQVNDDFWKINAIGKIGQGAGIYANLPSMSAVKLFVTNIVLKK